MIEVNFNRFSRCLDRWRKLGAALCIGGAMLIGGCSTIEDMGEATADGISTAANAMNPFNWFGDDDDKKTAADEKQKGTDTAAGQVAQNDPNKYPKLSTIPDRPKRVTSSKAKREREALRDGLVADTENAHYSDRELRAQQAAPPPAPPPAAPVATPPAGSADAVRSNERVTFAPAQTPVAAAPTAPQPSVAPAVPRVQIPPVTQQAQGATQVAREQAPQAAPQPAPVVPPAPSAVASVAPSQPSTTNPGQAVAPQVSARAPAQTAARTPAPTAPRRVLKTVQVATIYFNNGSSSLSRSDRRVVRQVAQIMQKTGGRVRVIGHSSVGGRMSDATQRETINYQTSLQRAKSVASELQRLGIPGNRIQVSAEGDRSPIYSEASPTGAAGNRRTEIYLDYIEGS
ncbi:MAG: OmpA family protein [Alphaproteobacteria bacterium]|nr:OmpA family protein [Alphaproteobacteria bacterium]